MIAMPAKSDAPFWREERGCYYGRYTDEFGDRKKVKLHPDLTRSAWLLEHLSRRAENIRLGVATSKQYQVADGGQSKPLDLLEAYCAELKGSRRSAGYIREMRGVVTRYAGHARLDTINQASTASIERWLSSLTATGRSSSTRNKYNTRLTTFFEWCVERQCLAENPATRAKRVDSDGGKDAPRALTLAEWRSLIDSTTDPYRRIAYLLGTRGGLRVWEAHRLKWEHVDLDGGWLVLPKTITKMKRSDEVPIPRVLLEALRGLERRGEHVCGPRTPSRYSWLRDLKRAGIIKTKPGVVSGNWSEDDMIGYRDDRGLVLSRRCLRKTCSTHMQMFGATQGQVMKFLRQRSAEMTNELYTDSRLLDLRGVADQMDGGTPDGWVSPGSDRMPNKSRIVPI